MEHLRGLQYLPLPSLKGKATVSKLSLAYRSLPVTPSRLRLKLGTSQRQPINEAAQPAATTRDAADTSHHSAAINQPRADMPIPSHLNRQTVRLSIKKEHSPSSLQAFPQCLTIRLFATEQQNQLLFELPWMKTKGTTPIFEHNLSILINQIQPIGHAAILAANFIIDMIH